MRELLWFEKTKRARTLHSFSPFNGFYPTPKVYFRSGTGVQFGAIVSK